MSLTEVVQAVRAVQEAQKRISPEMPKWKGATFFSKQDVWLYDARMDSKVCSKCRQYEDIGQFLGSHIRLIFPYLTILDMNTIGGPEPGGDGLVHPHCRCRLRRKLGDNEL